MKPHSIVTTEIMNSESGPRIWYLAFHNSPVFFILFCLSFLFIIYKNLKRMISSEEVTQDKLNKDNTQLTYAYIVLLVSIIGFFLSMYFGKN